MDKGKPPLALDSVFAFRTASGALLPYQRNAPAGFAPYANHLFLGGSNDVRGWRNYALGPSLCREPGCMVDGVQTTTDTIPLGGLASFYSSVEYRHYFSDVGFATFLDAGMVWDRVSSVRPSDIQPSVGIGGRYLSPIGPARLDFAYRLRDTPQFAAERKWNVHFALSETF